MFEGAKGDERFACEVGEERQEEKRPREQRNRAHGARCHPIIAFALPFRVAKW